MDRWAALGGTVLLMTVCCLGQSDACKGAGERERTPAEMAYANGNFADAEALFQQELFKQPRDPVLIAGLARSELRLGKLTQAREAVQAAMAEAPRSVPLLTAQADVQLHEGQPWLARETLDRAAAIDACFAQMWLLRSRIERLDSMYATERADIARAYAIDPKDAEVKRTWNRIVSPANDLASTEEYLATAKDLDAETRKAAEETVRTTIAALREGSQTCKGLPDAVEATLPLQPSRQDGQHIDGYRTEVSFGQTKTMLGVDTGASGFYISSALAEANGLEHRLGDPAGTVHAEAVQMGPLVFHDCVVGVSETPFPGKAAGFFGTDLLSQSLVTLNFVESKLEVNALPKLDSVVPGDRPRLEALAGFAPVYRRLQFLLAPVEVNGKERRLFVLDSGLRQTAMTLPMAHLVNTTQHGLTSPLRTTSGGTIEVYRDSFDLQFANELLRGRSGMLALNPATIEQHVGMQLGGMIGFDVLRSAVLQMDYRDGLIKVAFPAGEASPVGGSTLVARKDEGDEAGTCERPLPTEVATGTTLEARTSGPWDLTRLKDGARVTLTVSHPWETPTCHMDQGAVVYGKVTRVAKRDAGEELALVFDAADCYGKGRKEMPLRLVSVVAPPGAFVGEHTRVPVAIGGGRGRSIADPASALDQGDDQNFNPEARSAVVKTGSVLGLPGLELNAGAGRACAAVLTSGRKDARLGAQTKFVFVLEGAAAN